METDYLTTTIDSKDFKPQAFASDEDMVNHPSHYQSYGKDGIECIDAMIAAFGKTAVAHFCLCNSFKYQWRHSSKGGMEDIEKAQWYLNKYKELNVIELGE